MIHTTFARWRRPLARVCALAAWIVMIVSALRFRPDPLVELNQLPDRVRAYEFSPGRPRHDDVPFTGVSDAARLMLIGGGLLIAALALAGNGPHPRPLSHQRGEAAPRPDPDLATAGPTGWARGMRLARRYGIGVMLTLAGGAALAGLAQANARWHWDTGMASDEQFALLVAGGVLVAWGLARMGKRYSDQDRDQLPLRISGSVSQHKQDLALVLILTLLAFVLRVWHLNSAIHAFVDELNFASAALSAERVSNVPLLQPISPVIAFPRLYPYWESWGIGLLGRNLAGLRLTSALLGTLTIPALYGLARTLYDRQTAFSAAALLATLPIHVHFSRLGLNNIADPLFGTLALAVLAYALRTQRRLAYAGAGVLLGLTQYFYEAGRIVFPLLAAGWIGIGWIVWRRKNPAPSPIKNDGRGVLLTLLAAGMVAAPVYVTLFATDRPVAARAEAMIYPAEHWRALVSAAPESEIFRAHLRHVEETFLIYVHQHEASFYYAGETPFVLIYVAPLLLLGVFAALWRIRTPGGLLPLLWVLATSLGNSFMIANLDSPRYVTVFPALALLSALGLREGLRPLWPRPRLRRIALAGLVIALAAGQTWYYFGPHLDLFNFQYRRAKLDRDCEDALFRAADLPPGTQVHLISDPPCEQGYSRELFDYLTGSVAVDTLAPADLTADSLDDLPHSVGQAFFLAPDDQATLDRLKLYFRLKPPAITPYPLAPDKQLVLYYAPATITAAPDAGQE